MRYTDNKTDLSAKYLGLSPLIVYQTVNAFVAADRIVLFLHLDCMLSTQPERALRATAFERKRK